MIDTVIAILLAAAVTAAVFSIRKRKRQDGCIGCGGDCGSCRMNINNRDEKN